MIEVQPAQALDWPDCAERDARARSFAIQEHCNSFFDEAGRVIACFGLNQTHEQYLSAWSVLSALSVGQLAFATRWCRAYLKALRVRRIDMCVRGSFGHGQRWAALLGFGYEGIQHGFFPDGDNLHIWAMIDGRAVQHEGSLPWASCR